MKSAFRLLAVSGAAAAAVAVACSRHPIAGNATDELPAVLRPPHGALGVEQSVFPGKGSGVSYTVLVAYPAAGLVSEVQSRASSMGWSPSKEDLMNPGIPTSSGRGWTSYLDVSKGGRAAMHQWQSQWRNKDGGLLTYSFWYRTESVAGDWAPAVPDNDKLHVSAEVMERDVLENMLKQVARQKTPMSIPEEEVNRLDSDAPGGPRKHLLVRKGQLVLFTASVGTAIIQFTAERLGSAEYRWRFKPHSDGPEVSGSGQVFEAYRQERTGPHEVKVTDIGSQLLVRAGPLITVEWSSGGTSGNYLYVPSDMSARIVVGNLESIDLSQSR
jgi:hypothetical protein